MSAIIAGSSPLSFLIFHPSFFSLSSLCDEKNRFCIQSDRLIVGAKVIHFYCLADNPKDERKEKNHREISTNNESLTPTDHRVHLSRLGFGTQGFPFR